MLEVIIVNFYLLSSSKKSRKKIKLKFCKIDGTVMDESNESKKKNYLIDVYRSQEKGDC